MHILIILGIIGFFKVWLFGQAGVVFLRFVVGYVVVTVVMFIIMVATQAGAHMGGGETFALLLCPGIIVGIIFAGYSEKRY
jgi:hypothetical protein